MKSLLPFIVSVLVSAGLHVAVLKTPFPGPTPPSIQKLEPISVSIVYLPEQKKPDPEPEPKQTIIDIAKVSKPETEPLPEEKTEPPEEKPVEQVVQITSEQIQEMKESYWSEVSRRIAQHLTYPSAARRAGISGIVTAQIRIDANGRLVHSEIHSETCGRLFSTAAETAIAKATPFPPPDHALAPPVEAELPIRFEVR